MMPFKKSLLLEMPVLRCLSLRRKSLGLNATLLLLHICLCVVAADQLNDGVPPVETISLEIQPSLEQSEGKHILKKRSSDEDIDYEVYQGVVGRPGIDFPIYPRIPKTSFSCRSFGNGYFADMETDCQVFHICEEGRKISFLCPNGTIFQQSELTCDWWFKVNCLGSPGYYADSAEILTKQRLQRIRPAVPVQGFNIVGGGLDIKPKITKGPSTVVGTTPRSRKPSSNTGNVAIKPDRRMDSLEHVPEMADFDDLSAEKLINKGQTLQKIIPNNDYNNNQNNNKNTNTDFENNNNADDDESQITAESASFVAPNRRHKFGYDKSPSPNENRAQHNDLFAGGRRPGGAPRSNVGLVIAPGKPFSTDGSSTESRNNGPSSTPTVSSNFRGQQQQRQREERKPFGASGEKTRSSAEHKTHNKLNATSGEISPHSFLTDGRPKKSSFSITSEAITTKATPLSSRGQQQLNATTSFPSGTYSTARRLDNTRTTPFYTPTVPSIVKAKTTESKTAYFAKGTKVGGGASLASTPNPNRINPASGTGASLIFDAAPGGTSKNTFGLTPDFNGTIATRSTPRPLVIGLRHESSERSSGEVPLKTSNNANNWVDQPSRKTSTKFDTTTLRPHTTGPTYLPTIAARPTAPANSAGDGFLFAPGPTVEIDESVNRNVDEMLKTINRLKDELGKNGDVPAAIPPREGLEIPPSSGPDVLISLAKYFAGADEKASEKNRNQLTAATPKISVATPNEKLQATKYEPLANFPGGKPSDTTATLTTLATPVVAVKSDDIKAGLLREKTVNEYSNLFGIKDPKSKTTLTDPSEGLLSHTSKDAKNTTSKSTKDEAKDVYGLFPNIASTDATIRELAEKPDSRKIAQVFSNALSTYLEDPTTFREQLASVRPTAPPQRDTPNFTPVTVKDTGLFNGGTGATYLPTRPTSFTTTTPVTPTTRTTTTTATRTTSKNTIAAEINRKFEGTRTTNGYISTTDFSSIETTTTTTNPRLNRKDAIKVGTHLELSAELVPPGGDSGERDEFLQREQTQSFVASRNQLPTDKSNKKSSQQTSIGQKSSTTPATNGLSTENPWVHISQTDFLDPLTINDGLMRESTSTTSSPFTYLPKKVISPSTTTSRPRTTTTPASRIMTTTFSSRNRGGSSSPSQRLELERNNRYVGSAEVTTIPPASSYYRSQSSSSADSTNANSWHDLFESYDIPRDTLPSSSGLQRIANKLFGGLNETEALHLKNVMLQAEHNRQVLGLLLLLIQTCDDQNGKALERSRKHLLNALIDMDSKQRAIAAAGKVSHQKANNLITSTGRTPTATTIITGGVGGSVEDSNQFSTTIWSTTTELPSNVGTTTQRSWGSIEETTKFEIRVPDLDDEGLSTTVPSPTAAALTAPAKTSTTVNSSSSSSSDKRALELLKSLYSLASKFSSRR